MNFSFRLREERERLELNQVEFGAIGGVKKLAQINYEKGAREPDASYLAAISTVGADVLYILTGRRGQPVSAGAALGAQQRALLNSFEMCTPAAQKQLLQLAALLAAGLPAGEQKSVGGDVNTAKVKNSLFGFAKVSSKDSGSR